MAAETLRANLRTYNPEDKITDADIAKVVRCHGVRVASVWSDRTDFVVRRIAQRLDGYSRGRGRPSQAEFNRQPPRPDCSCRFCLDTYLNLITIGPRRNYAGQPLKGEWRHLAACADQTDVFFPKVRKYGYADPEAVDFTARVKKMPRYRPEVYEPAKAICAACPVREKCLEFALANEYRHGVWGGLDWFERDLLAGYLPTGKRFE